MYINGDNTMFRRLWYFILRSVSLAPYREIEVLIKEILKMEETLDVLKEDLKESEEERKSLWLMLDELDDSSKIKKENVDDLMKDLQDTLIGEMLKDFEPAGEA
jgi:hypothetical protein|tara:strand:+ start:1412 stop:1723 length:312 start_codon:yes stop_codon:yes gene_type:complete